MINHGRKYRENIKKIKKIISHVIRSETTERNQGRALAAERRGVYNRFTVANVMATPV